MNRAGVTAVAPLRAIAEELLRAGVRDVVICPGSRSTPLALALRAARGLRTWVQLDERAGAFFALGAAKGSRRPVAVLATSGTAVVNFAPAVAEARYGRVPLILLTADRPPELQGIGSPQTIDQVELYGRHAKWYASLPVPDASAETEAEVRGLVSRAVSAAVTAPAGPVQLNLPFREPLLPEGTLWDEPGGGGPRDEVEPPATTGLLVTAEPRPVPVEEVERAAEDVAGARRPLIACGPMDAPGVPVGLARLAVSCGAPILADGLSNLRNGAHDRSRVIAHTDALLRIDGFAAEHTPDVILRFGARPTSRVLDRHLDGWPCRQLLVDDGGGWNLPSGGSLVRVDADPAAFASALADVVGADEAAVHAGWLEGWQDADRTADVALRDWLAALDEPFEGSVPPALAEAVPEGAVVVGNSMPVRDFDAFAPCSTGPARILGNRGANGIDGLLSTAFGVAAVSDVPVVAVVGDISFLHDLGALVSAPRLGIEATVVLVNNDGGGIFSFLPQAAVDRPELGLPQHYEELFGTPHGIDFGPLVTSLGASYRRLEHGHVAEAVAASLSEPGIRVLEQRTERARNVELHREALAAVAAALAAAPERRS